MDSFRKSRSSARGLAVQWLGDKWEMLLGVSIMIKITAITRATLLTRDREMVLRASNAPLDSKLLLQRCSSSPSPARAGSAPHNWGGTPGSAAGRRNTAHPHWAFCSFCGLVFSSPCIWFEMPARWPSLCCRDGLSLPVQAGRVCPARILS